MFLPGTGAASLRKILLRFTERNARRFSDAEMSALVAAAAEHSDGLAHLLKAYGKLRVCKESDRRFLRGLAKASSLAGLISLPEAALPVLQRLTADGASLIEQPLELSLLSSSCPSLVMCVQEREIAGTIAPLRPLLGELAEALEHSLGQRRDAPSQLPVSVKEGSLPFISSVRAGHRLSLRLRSSGYISTFSQSFNHPFPGSSFDFPFLRLLPHVVLF